MFNFKTVYTFLFYILQFYSKEISHLPIFLLSRQSSLKSNLSKLHFRPKNTSRGLLSFLGKQ